MTYFNEWRSRRAARAGAGALLEADGKVALVVLGLGYPCWRCGEIGTALVGLAEDRDGLDAYDVVACDDKATLALADHLLPDEARRRFSVGEVRPRYTRTTRSTYLSNGCPGCGAVFGRHFVVHEALPEALATGGVDALERLAVVSAPAAEWSALLAARWG